MNSVSWRMGSGGGWVMSLDNACDTCMQVKLTVDGALAGEPLAGCSYVIDVGCAHTLCMCTYVSVFDGIREMQAHYRKQIIHHIGQRGMPCALFMLNN